MQTPKKTAQRSFINYDADSNFPIQNLPYGVFSPLEGGPKRVGVAIGDFVLDLAALEKLGFFNGLGLPSDRTVFDSDSLNSFMALGRPVWSAVRKRISWLLDIECLEIQNEAKIRQAVLVPLSNVCLSLPMSIGDYTDFYSSRYHAYNVGVLMRGPENALQPNWLQLPVGYHGRSSSVVLSGTDVVRPWGQIKNQNDPDPKPAFSPTKMMDYELEIGFVIGKNSKLGSSITESEVNEYIFGLVLVNDWSARDIQAWEYVPLGPFLSKNFCTSISPWVVPMEALENFKCDNQVQEPEPLSYLKCNQRWNYDINLSVEISTDAQDPVSVCNTNSKYLYWNFCQQLIHHTVNGCPVRVGDLMATGTISGPTQDSLGCLLEATSRGKNPIELPSGEKRSFLADGDQITISGFCKGDGFKIGFGEVTGKIMPAREI